MSKTKICITCKMAKLIDSYGKATSNKTGINNKCKECVKEYNAQYSERNKEKLKASQREYYRDNREKLIKYRADYLERNREKVNKQKREHYHANKDNMRSIARKYHHQNRSVILPKLNEYYANNKETMLEYNSNWYKENPDKARMIGQRYESRKNSVEQTLTIEEWQDILSYYGESCAYCGMTTEEHFNSFNEQLHQDHVVPLIKRGVYSKENIVPACRSCNSSKCDKDITSWYKEYKHYNEHRFTKIKKHISI